ncbi:cysteine synthase A [Aestuariibacter salexigens]|uniref:cysteine synthase A n=1 Tax=Aestuariibacter salexigens TaxID=226010 RepID=UPI00042A4BB4|nr:cysteine synthase A [Aestuariibacter salexigens]
MRVYQNQAQQIGNTDLLRIASLSELTGCDIFIKCEHQNPGGSIKDRAALRMVQDAIDAGHLTPGMTIVEGTAGNTGIGLALVAKALGYDMLTVMPSGQTPEKEKMITLHGATLKLVKPCPFKDPNHFYHTARRLGEENESYWWANQFENLSNFYAHFEGTGPEIWQQTQGKIDAFVSVCGTGGTVAGNSAYLKQQNPDIKNWLVDPDGSGIYQYLKSGEYKSSGSSFTEGIGIMRLVENFKRAKLDHAVNLPDQDLVTLSRFVRDNDGIVLGSSSALNVCGAVFAAAKMGVGKRIVTFSCDLGERSYSKLYNPEFLADCGIDEKAQTMVQLFKRYQSSQGPDYLTLG